MYGGTKLILQIIPLGYYFDSFKTLYHLHKILHRIIGFLRFINFN